MDTFLKWPELPSGSNCCTKLLLTSLQLAFIMHSFNVVNTNLENVEGLAVKKFSALNSVM